MEPPTRLNCFRQVAGVDKATTAAIVSPTLDMCMLLPTYNPAHNLMKSTVE